MNIKNIIAGSISAAGKYLLFFMVFIGVFTMTSCSESDDTEDEYENWQERNDAYFNNIYSQAETAIKSGDKSWKIIRTFSKDSLAAKAKTDFIVVHVETEGTGTECPIYTDKVRVHYRGNLIPSTNYTDGYQFESSWTGDYNLKTMSPKDFDVNGSFTGTASDATIGLTTALMNMHKGDRWTVYIPYALGYATKNHKLQYPNGTNYVYGATIPAYSTQKFDVTLVDYAHAGKSLPKFQ